MQNLYYISLWVFLFWVILFAVLEVFFAKRKYVDSKKSRWPVNIGFTVFNSLIIRTLPFTPVLVAFYAENNNIGLFNAFLDIPLLLEIFIVVVIFDFIIWCHHIAFHKIPFLWRFHKVHHSDIDMDFTTALRFHIWEAFQSIVLKSCVVLLFGFAALPVLIFEILLNFSAMFNHANIKLPRRIDTIVSKLIVTPDFHEMHHSDQQKETDSNYGFFLSIWDYIFHTYTPHKAWAETIGLDLKKKPTLGQLFLTKF